MLALLVFLVAGPSLVLGTSVSLVSVHSGLVRRNTNESGHLNVETLHIKSGIVR